MVDTKLRPWSLGISEAQRMASKRPIDAKSEAVNHRRLE